MEATAARQSTGQRESPEGARRHPVLAGRKTVGQPWKPDRFRPGLEGRAHHLWGSLRHLL